MIIYNTPNPQQRMTRNVTHLATLVAQSGRSPGHSPPRHVARSSPNNS